MRQPRLHHWSADLCDFVRFDLSGCGKIELKKIFHDHISIVGFSNSTWASRQNGRDYVETANDIIVRDAGQVFSATMEQAQASDVSCREIHISPRQIKTLYDLAEGEVRPIYFSIPVLNNAQVRTFLWTVHGAAESGAGNLEVSSRFCQLLQHLSFASHGESFVVKPYARSHKIKWVVDYIRAYCEHNIGLMDLSALVQANPYVLLRQFRKEMGVTPHEYQGVCRLNKARRLLRDGAPLTQVAYDCGYTDQSHMTRCFKKHLGITPGRYVRGR